MAMPFDNTQPQEAWAQHGQHQGPDTQVPTLAWYLTGGLRAHSSGLLTALEHSLCLYPTGHSDPVRNSCHSA